MEHLKELEYLWKEYQYRHDLIWRISILLTIVIVSLSIVPYIKDALIVELKCLMVIPPIVALIISLFGSAVLYNEYGLLKNVKNAYRLLQNRFYHRIQGYSHDECKIDCKDKCKIHCTPDRWAINLHNKDKTSWFKYFLIVYHFVLFLLTAANALFIHFYWIERILLKSRITTWA